MTDAVAHRRTLDRRAAVARRRRRFPPLLVRSAQLAVLTGFALSQPLFDILGRNATFFVARRSTSLEIVLFALAVTFLPAVVLVLAERGAAIVSPRLAYGLHLFFVGALVALIALQALKRVGLLSGSTPLLVVSTVLGAGALLLYSEARTAHTFLAVLSPAPLLFLALFLGGSDVSKLVFDEEEEVATARTGSETPVVLVIFDEFSTIALMNEKQQIDRERYPSFASLADDATWYRSATGVHTHSESAVPAILTGQLPEKGLLPTASDHPRNIFTLFGGDYRLHVFESLTRLCTRSLCKKSTSEAQETSSVQGGAKSLVSDVSVVYLHLLLPRGLEHRVPPIGEAWGNFRGLEQTSAPTRGGLECARGLCEFIKALKRDRAPSLYLAHTLLPHVPWTYLPSGRRYTGSVRLIPGAEDLWRPDDWLTVQAYQRYLLQLAYTDLELGLVIDRLRSEGIYDRAILVVTADHGLSFRPGEPRRHATRGNLADVAFVPMFVKFPRQGQGQVVDGFARTIDILPTIARAAHTRIPWTVDGRPLRQRLPRNRQVSLVDKDDEPVSAPLSVLLAERRAALARQIAEFGTGSRERLYRIGPHQSVLGKRVLELAARPASDVRVEIDQAQLLNAVDLRSEIIPAYVTGRILGGSGEDEELALALNGTIVATTRTYDDSGEERFQAVAPERMFRKGSNTLELFGVSGTSEQPALQRLRASSSAFVIRRRDGREVVETGEGTRLGIVNRALSGEVHAITPGESVILRGWAADLDGRQAADSVAVFLDGRSVLVLPVDLRQKLLKDRYGIERAGFRAELPKRLLPAWGQGHRLRILALRGQVASELRYEGGYLRSGRR